MDPFQSVYSPGDAGAPEATPSRQIWFSDGNIILEAANTSFRVYSQLIAAKSTVLADILAFPQYTLHETPVVRLLDAAEDLEALLRAILDSK